MTYSKIGYRNSKGNSAGSNEKCLCSIFRQNETFDDLSSFEIRISNPDEISVQLGEFHSAFHLLLVEVLVLLSRNLLKRFFRHFC